MPQHPKCCGHTCGNTVQNKVECQSQTQMSKQAATQCKSKCLIVYDLGNSDNSDEEKSPIAKRCKNTRPKCEPSSACIKADTFTTKPPQPYHYEYQPGTLKQHQITRLTR